MQIVQTDEYKQKKDINYEIIQNTKILKCKFAHAPGVESIAFKS